MLSSPKIPFSIQGIIGEIKAVKSNTKMGRLKLNIMLRTDSGDAHFANPSWLKKV